MLLAGNPGFPAMLLALRPGLDAMLLGSRQMWADLLVCVKQEILHIVSRTVIYELACLCLCQQETLHAEEHGRGPNCNKHMHPHQLCAAGTCPSSDVTSHRVLSGVCDWTCCDDEACEWKKDQRVRIRHLNLKIYKSLYHERSWGSPGIKVYVVSRKQMPGSSQERWSVCVCVCCWI